MKNTGLGLLLTGLATVGAANGQAQEADVQDAAIASQAEAAPQAVPATTRALDEIIVSAQKREASLQDVPAAISAIGSADLEVRGIQSSSDIAMQIPNFNYSQVNGSALLSIRGVGLEIITGVGEPAVAMHIDGVYQPRVATSTVGTYDLERIEVLRGPQGTLYGRNANAGAINFITKPPADEFEVSGHAGYGNFNAIAMDFGVTGPVTDWLSARFSAMYESRDGYVDNLSNGQDLMGSKAQGARAAFRASLFDNVTADLIAYTQYNESNGPIQQPVTAPQFPSTLGAGFSLDPHKERLDVEPVEEVNLWAVTGIVEWDAPLDMTVKSITGFTHSDQTQTQPYDGDSTDAEFILVGRDDASDSFTEELNISGRAFEGWSFGTLDWIGGVFYLKEDLQQSIPVDFPNGLVPLPPPLTSAITDQLGITLDPVSGGPLALHMEQKHVQTTVSYAGFVDLSFTMLDLVTLVAGGRYSVDEKEVSQTRTFLIGDSCTDLKDERRWESFSPKIGVQTAFMEDHMVYAQYQEGFKSGGFNLSGCGDQFEPELIEAFEVGFKTAWFDGLMTINGAAFTYDYTDLQVFQIRNFSGQIDNAGAAEVNGAELEIVASPIEGLRLNVALSWLDATYSEFEAVDGLDPNNTPGLIDPSLATPEDLNGRHLNRAPEKTIFVGAEYELPIGNAGYVTLRGEYFWTDEFYFRPFERDFDTQESYSLVNAFLTWMDQDRGYQVRAWGKNLADQDYLVAAWSSDVTLQMLGSYAPPRMYGIDVRARF